MAADKKRTVRPVRDGQMLLTRQQAAEMLVVSPRTIYDWARDGFIEQIQVGGGVRYRRSEIEHIVAHGLVLPDEEEVAAVDLRKETGTAEDEVPGEEAEPE